LEEPVPIPGYRLLHKVADGGCGEIYEAEDFTTHRRVAVKILHPRHYGSKAETRRLLNEGATGMRLRHHPNLIQTIKVGQVDRVPYIILELAAGESLRDILRERTRLSEGEVLRLAVALTGALRYMHDNGVYHKDVKPENVMVDGASVKLLDLGFAETRLAVSLSFLGRTLDGSPAYLAPEYIQEKRPSPATDLYALGCTLYETAAGFVPFTGLSDQEILAKQAAPDLRPQPLADVNPGFTFQTTKLIHSLLEKSPAVRFKSADEVWLELGRHPARPLDGIRA
jgi:eukaryotic-like serine/threonine-protein kinase